MSKMFTNFVCLALFAAFSVHFANSLNCYQCNSNIKEECDEMKQPIESIECKSNDTTRKNNQKLAEVLKLPFDSQSMMYCLRVFLKDKHGDQQSYRECYEDFKVFAPCEMVTKSLTNENDHISVDDCEVCDTDLCNGNKLLYRNDASNSSRMFFDIWLIFILLGVIFWKF